jgi:hypothetical protein
MVRDTQVRNGVNNLVRTLHQGEVNVFERGVPLNQLR